MQMCDQKDMNATTQLTRDERAKFADLFDTRQHKRLARIVTIGSDTQIHFLWIAILFECDCESQNRILRTAP